MEQSAIRESGQSSKKLKIRVFCTTSFEGFHAWENAPDTVAYLRNRHRHIFHVRAEMHVKHDDRDIEFITLKDDVERTIYYLQDIQREVNTETWSCERWAVELMKHCEYPLSLVEVSEDSENGAVVESVTE